MRIKLNDIFEKYLGLDRNGQKSIFFFLISYKSNLARIKIAHSKYNL